MTRSILLLSCLLVAAPLIAGRHADTVKELGDEAKRAVAIETLSKAGLEAFDDLMDGLRTERAGEGDELRRTGQIRLGCARLLGVLADSRAGEELLKHFETEGGKEVIEDGDFAAACAIALGQVWAAKAGEKGRADAAGELKRIAAYENTPAVVRHGCLRGLASLREGAEVAAPLLKQGEELVRSAAIAVVRACVHKAAADDLLDIWETQRFGPKGEDGKRAGANSGDYARPLGIQAVLALAAMEDNRAVEGLVDIVTRPEFSALTSLRTHAIHLLKGEALKPAALEALKAVIKNEEAAHQWNPAATALGDLGAQGVETLLSIADEPAPEGKPEQHYRARVDNMLVSLTSETALKAFVAAWGTLGKEAEKKSVREKILIQLINWRTSLRKEGLQVFREAAGDTTFDAPRRAQAINAFCESRGRESFGELQGWLKDEDPVIRAQAVQNLGGSYIPITKSRPLLLEVLEGSRDEKYAKARQNALQGLQRSDDKALLQVFLDAMDHEKEKSADVRREAMTAVQNFCRNVKQLKEEDIFEPIRALCDDADEAVRASAIGAAAGMAERVGQAKVSNEIVEKALGDASETVRNAAWGQVGVSAREVKLDVAVDAALKETKLESKIPAVQALSQMNSLAGLATQQEKLEALVLMGVDVAENQGYRGSNARALMRKLSKESGAFSLIARKTLDAIDRNAAETPKRYQRIATLVPILTEIEDESVVEKIKELAQETDVELRRACIGYFNALGRKDDIAFLRSLQGKGDHVAGQVRSDIDRAVTAIEDRG